MKIVIAGASPYMMSSRGKIHSLLMKHLYLLGYSIMGVAWGHDENYSPLENGKFFFDFDHNSSIHQIPVVSVPANIEPSVAMYEVIKSGNPDIVITIGSIEESSYMHAVKQFNPIIKWMAILTNYAFPIHDDKKDIINDMDAILCSSHSCYDQVKSLYDGKLIERQYVGCDTDIFTEKDYTSSSQFKIIACAKSSPIKNTAMLMEVVAEIRREIPSICLYVHTNVHDNRGYDLMSVREKVDPDAEFIEFPQKYISTSDGISDEELCKLFQSADLYVSIPLVSATSMGAFHAMACGCFPILSDCGSNRDIASSLEKHSNGEICRNDVLIPGINFMTKGETYLNICDPCKLKEKIVSFYKNKEKHKGLRRQLSEFTQKHAHTYFVRASEQILGDLKRTGNSSYIDRIRPETVGD